MEIIRDQGESDPVWYYRRGYSMWYLDGREEESETALLKAKELAKEGEPVAEWCDELLEMIEDWRNNDESEEDSEEVDYNPEVYTKEEMDLVEAHIAAHFGKYDNVYHELVSPDIHVDICVIEPTPERNYYTLVTIGMGAHRMNVPEELRDNKLNRAEVLFTLPPDWDINNEDEKWYWPLRWLKILARLPVEQDTWLAYGHTVPSGGPLAENNEFCCVMMTMPYHFGQESAACQMPDGDEINFYQVIPLYESEMNFKIANSAEKLENLFPDDFDMVVDVNRANVVEN